MNSNSLMIAVMSYGMGMLLRNCLESLQRHAEGIEVRLYDDGSSDSETLSVIHEYERQIPIYVNAWRDHHKTDHLSGHQKVGGLWSNMVRAYREARDEGFEYIAFVQDDMQAVGPLSDVFFEEHSAIWNDRNDIVQIRITYYRDPLVDPNHHPDRNRVAENGMYYMATPVPRGISATGIISIPRLEKAGYVWENGEGPNHRKSMNLGLYSAFPKTPLIPQLPWPPVIKTRLEPFKRHVTAVADRIFSVGFHPYRNLEAYELAAMRARDPHIRPFGEDFFSLASGRKLFQPWCYENSYAHLRVAAKQILRNMTGKGHVR